MLKNIFLDIETIPAQRSDVRSHLAAKIGKKTAIELANVRAPSNYKDAAKIADYIESAKAALLDGEQAAIDEAVNKTGLNGAFGQVVCIGIALDDAAPTVIHGMNECENLLGLNVVLDQVRKADWYSTSIVGHNVSAFDLRFLLQRFIVNQVKPHPIIVRGANAKPWQGEIVYDTMTQFAGTGNRISLDDLCVALGLPGKGDITGADVWPMVQAGKLKEVADYCADDVTKTREVFKRMTFATVEQQEFEDVAA
jgi:hypothetical protein